MAPTVPQQNVSLPQKVRKLEEAIITISGPALATSGIIAGIDILTNNIIAKYAPTVGAIAGVVWAVCLMLTLDFQVLTLGVRAHRIYSGSDKKGVQKFFEILLVCTIAAALAYVSLQMGSIFAKMIGTTLSIEQAELQLGINSIALIYERSAMVMLLIFMSGWLRDIEAPDNAQMNIATPAPAESSLSQADMQTILAALSEVQALKQTLATIVSPVEQATASIPQEADSLLSAQDALNKPGEPSGDLVSKLASYGESVAAIYAKNQQITPAEIVKELGCAYPTAVKWLDRCKPV